jgi:hypothetical protein
MPRINLTFRAITAGSPVNLFTQTTSAPAASSQPVYAREVLIQMLHSATVGLGFVLAGINIGRVPSVNNDGDVATELAPATANVPGGTYADTFDHASGGIDIRTIWIDVAVTNTPVKASIDLLV